MKEFRVADSAEMTTDSIPIACNLSERERTERGHAIAGDIMSGVVATHELEDGFAFQFPGDEPWPERIQAFVLAERRCCPFFTIELVFDPGQGPIWLRLRGAEGTKAFVAETFPGRTSNT